MIFVVLFVQFCCPTHIVGPLHIFLSFCSRWIFFRLRAVVIFLWDIVEGADLFWATWSIRMTRFAATYFAREYNANSAYKMFKTWQ